MSRVKNGPSHHKRVKKVLKQAKGYRGRRSKLYHSAKDAIMRALSYAYRDRRRKKRDFRRLWIMRINAAMEGMEGMEGTKLKYSEFINGLKKADIRLNRKVLSNLAYEDPEGFKVVVEHAKAVK